MGWPFPISCNLWHKKSYCPMYGETSTAGAHPNNNVELHPALWLTAGCDFLEAVSCAHLLPCHSSTHQGRIRVGGGGSLWGVVTQSLLSAGKGSGNELMAAVCAYSPIIRAAMWQFVVTGQLYLWSSSPLLFLSITSNRWSQWAYKFPDIIHIWSGIFWHWHFLNIYQHMAVI